VHSVISRQLWLALRTKLKHNESMGGEIRNLASLSGQLHLSQGFALMGSSYATVAFGTATIVEVLGYYIPWLDHLLDIVATPAAIIAKTVASASVATEMSPFLQWTLAFIAGGGIAGLVQGATVALRATSLLATAGIRIPQLPLPNWPDQSSRLSLPSLSPLSALRAFCFFSILVIRKAGRFVFGRWPSTGKAG